MNIIINAVVAHKVKGAVSGLPLMFDRMLRGGHCYEEDEKAAGSKRQAAIEKNDENATDNELNKLHKANDANKKRIHDIKTDRATKASNKDPVEVIEEDEDQEKEAEGRSFGQR